MQDIWTRAAVDEADRVPRAEDEGLRAAIRVPKTAELIADHIRKRIIRGELRESDTLPPEGQLMTSLGISRPTLREAFRILEAEHLISVTRGSRTGARINTPRVESVSRYAGFVLQAQHATVADVYDARLAIEPFVVRRLAETTSVEMVTALRMEIARLTQVFEDARYIDFMIALSDFHRVLVSWSGNRTLMLITDILHDVVARYQVSFFQRRLDLTDEQQRRRSAAGVRSFNRLVDLIEAGRGDEAEAHWSLHVANANKAWVTVDDANTLIETID